jgi:excisionase family DNA binding protein
MEETPLMEDFPPREEYGFPTLVDTKKIAHLLGVPENRIYKLVHQGRIPYYKVGGKLQFDPEEIREWLLASHNQPNH